MDFFCLRPNGIRVAYPSRSVLRHLRPRVRRSVRGRVVLALTANPDYALLGVRPGDALGPVAGRLHTQAGFQLGRNRWYVLPAGASRGVLKVRRGVIQEIGIANRSLTAGAGAARRLLAGLN